MPGGLDEKDLYEAIEPVSQSRSQIPSLYWNAGRCIKTKETTTSVASTLCGQGDVKIPVFIADTFLLTVRL